MNYKTLSEWAMKIPCSPTWNNVINVINNWPKKKKKQLRVLRKKQNKERAVGREKPDHVQSTGKSFTSEMVFVLIQEGDLEGGQDEKETQ